MEGEKPLYTQKHHSALLAAPNQRKKDELHTRKTFFIIKLPQVAAPSPWRKPEVHTRATFYETQPPQLAAPSKGRKAALQTKAIERSTSSPKATGKNNLKSRIIHQSNIQPD